MHRVSFRALIGVLSLAPLGWASDVYAGNEEMKACAAAAEKAQRYRNDGRLKDSQEQLILCARSTCPAVIRKDCEPWLTELDGRLPTVVVAAKDGKGKDVLDVHVLVDGVVAAKRLDGKAIQVDPGSHTFRYERDGSVTVETTVVVREGEKNRVLEVQFDPPPPERPELREEPVPTRERPKEKGSLPVSGLIVGGLGLVGVGAFVFFDLSAKSSVDDLRTTCAPHCTSSDVDPINTKMIVADVSLGAGIVALGVATWLIVSHYSSAKQPAQVQIGLAPLPHGGVGGLHGSF